MTLTGYDNWKTQCPDDDEPEDFDEQEYRRDREAEMRFEWYRETETDETRD